MEADGVIFTGVILTRVGHILVPATATKAEVLRAKIVDFQPVKIVAVDTESDLAVIKADGQRNLRPVALGSTDDLLEYSLIPLPNPSEGYSYAQILVISTRRFPQCPQSIA